MIGKIYAYLGKNDITVQFPTGTAGGSLVIEFTGGNINNRDSFSLAKTKVITEPVFQQIIEASPDFGTKIVIVEARDYSESHKEDEVNIHEEVTTMAEAVDVLKNEFGVKPQQLRSPAAVRKIAKGYNVEFPNWN